MYRSYSSYFTQIPGHSGWAKIGRLGRVGSRLTAFARYTVRDVTAPWNGYANFFPVTIVKHWAGLGPELEASL